MNLVEFLRARLDEDEQDIARAERLYEQFSPYPPSRLLAEVEAKRRILEWHENWPILVDRPPEIETTGDSITDVTMRMTQQIAWMTEKEYRDRFGDEPPFGPVLQLLALPYADHADYNPDWR